VIAKVEVDSHQESGPFASHGTYWQLSSDNQSLFLSTNKPGQSDIVVLDLMTGKERRRVPLPMTKGAGTGPMSLSPNGRTLAVAIKGTLATIGVDGTGYRAVYTSAGDLDFIRHHAWTKDGRSVLVLVAGRRSTQIIRVPAEGGVATFTGLDVSRMGSFDVSPDGRRILFDGLAPSTSSFATGR
jgi:Tol biopolymer transport system component